MSDTEALKPKAHTIRLTFNDTEDQLLYAALGASSDREHRTPLPRHVKYLLEMAMGLRKPDLFLSKRLGFSDVDEYDIGRRHLDQLATRLDSIEQDIGIQPNKPKLRLV